MKMTIDLPDGILEGAKRLARSEGTTLRAIIERALRRELGGSPTFRLREASVDGRGLREAYADGEWSAIRDASYERRGE